MALPYWQRAMSVVTVHGHDWERGAVKGASAYYQGAMAVSH